MKVLYVAELVGKAGVFCAKKVLADLRRELGIDFVIACADGATGGKGLGLNHAAYLRKLGADAITLGDYCFFKRDLTENMGNMPFVLRPANLCPGAPGFGSFVFKAAGKKIAVAVLLGQSGFSHFHSENPVTGLEALLTNLREKTPYIIVDYHAAASAEKQVLFYAADSLCSAVIGSHCRVQTADERILSGGTAIITDAGRTGSQISVCGTEIKSVISSFISGIPEWLKEAWDGLELQGVLIDIDNDGKAVSIARIRRSVGRDELGIRN
ncbi:MAG: YmdB family metallophosphoesterase [Spirochaetaceae bacterium]|jgi:metallophosphoesterase (TIGR00282 family)|nr:YmdB family metallophosphoesterase [Spirochaetaceae bacterium]